MKLISDFAERLRIALDFRNMKATELSELTGINKSTISQYLSKEYEPKRERIELFAKTLNVNEVWLTGYDVPMEINSSDKNDSLIEKYELSPEELKEYEVAEKNNLAVYLIIKTDNGFVTKSSSAFKKLTETKE